MSDPGDWRPSAERAELHLRARANATIRAFFERRDVLEVETPILSRAANSDPRIASFETGFSGPQAGGGRQRFLRTSPEFALKRLLAAGCGDCYELGRVFRNGEAGRRHNPEFTLLEWYRCGWDHLRLMEEVAELACALLALVGRQAVVVRSTYRALFRERLGIDPLTATIEELQQAMAGHGVQASGLERDDWLDLLLTHRLQPQFAADQLLLVHDFPASQCALARIVERDGVAVAERFEAFLGPLEIANGYHELRDATEQRARFAADNRRRLAAGLAEMPLDEHLLAALQHGLPACAGVALGVDRLLLAMLDGAALQRVIAFPFARA